MKTSGMIAVLAGASVAEAFVTIPLVGNPSAVTLRQSRTSCVSSAKSTSGRQSTATYMVAAPAKEDTVAAVPHGGTLVDLTVKTEEEKKVMWCAVGLLCCSIGVDCVAAHHIPHPTNRGFSTTT